MERDVGDIGRGFKAAILRRDEDNAWQSMVAASKGREISAATVNLEGSAADGDGQHDEIPHDEHLPGKCWCEYIYGKERWWGCRWFELWRRNIELARKWDAKLLVYYPQGMVGKGKVLSWETLGEEYLRREDIRSRRQAFYESDKFKRAKQAGLDELSKEPGADGSSPYSREEDRLFMAWLPQEDSEFLKASAGLGNFQKAEVAWLDRKRYKYTDVDVSTWLFDRGSAKQIAFEGAVVDEQEKPCICSWPGKYGSAWDCMVQAAEGGQISAAVVFLPKGTTEPAPLLNNIVDLKGHDSFQQLERARMLQEFGKHAEIPPQEKLEGDCWCIPLYGEQKPWGCRWVPFYPVSNIPPR